MNVDRVFWTENIMKLRDLLGPAVGLCTNKRTCETERQKKARQTMVEEDTYSIYNNSGNVPWENRVSISVVGERKIYIYSLKGIGFLKQ